MYALRAPDSRPVVTRAEFKSVVAFFAHALAPEELSTDLINKRMAELGLMWPEDAVSNDRRAFLWLQFPVYPPAGAGGQSTRVDFYIIPVFGREFIVATRQVGNPPFQWVAEAAMRAVREAHDADKPVTLGWGALTKNAVDHGAAFWKHFCGLRNNARVRSTHGDAGSVALVIEALQLAGVGQSSRIAVIGANGAIGESIARQLNRFDPSSILLVGRPDKSGETKNLVRLTELAQAVKGHEVLVHQHMDRACLEHRSTVVVVATNGIEKVHPNNLLEHTLVFDVTAPPACSQNEDWNSRDIMVLRAGCGQFQDPRVIPEEFGFIQGEHILDVGAGGERVIWGCTGETIARAVFDRRGHLAGPAVPDNEVEWSRDAFQRLSFAPQPPNMFGRTFSWAEVHEHGR